MQSLLEVVLLQMVRKCQGVASCVGTELPSLGAGYVSSACTPLYSEELKGSSQVDSFEIVSVSSGENQRRHYPRIAYRTEEEGKIELE